MCMFLSEQMFEGNFYVVLRGLFSCAIPLTKKFDNLLVCDDKNAQVFTLEVKFVRRQVLQLQSPLAVALSNAGQVFIIDTGKHSVHVFERTTCLSRFNFL